MPTLAQGEGRDPGRQHGDQDHAHERAETCRQEGERQGFGSLALLRHRIAVEGGRDG
jgi:hypothetical protein